MVETEIARAKPWSKQNQVRFGVKVKAVTKSFEKDLFVEFDYIK